MRMPRSRMRSASQSRVEAVTNGLEASSRPLRPRRGRLPFARGTGDRGAESWKSGAIGVLPGDGDAPGTEGPNNLPAGKPNEETRKRVEAAAREFVAYVNHEFRTPLTSIQGYSELLALGSSDRDEVAEFAGIINVQAQRLEQMVSEVMLLDRLDGRRPILSPRQTDLNDLLRNLGSTYRMRHPERLCTLDLADDVPLIEADPIRLNQTLKNLMDSAGEMSNPPGRIRVVTANVAEGVRIQLLTIGAGSPITGMSHLFEQMYHPEPDQPAVYRGLDLPIARAVVRLHGGEARVESLTTGEIGYHLVLPMRPPVDTVLAATG